FGIQNFNACSVEHAALQRGSARHRNRQSQQRVALSADGFELIERFNQRMICVPSQQYRVASVNYRREIQSQGRAKVSLAGLRGNVRRERGQDRHQRWILKLSAAIIPERIAARLDGTLKRGAVLD